MKMKLLQEIKSSTKNRIYGLIGEEVDLISDHGGVLIVKNKNGETFPVQRVKVEEK